MTKKEMRPAEIVYRMAALWFFNDERSMPAPARESVTDICTKIVSALCMPPEIRDEAARIFWERIGA